MVSDFARYSPKAESTWTKQWAFAIRLLPPQSKWLWTILGWLDGGRGAWLEGMNWLWLLSNVLGLLASGVMLVAGIVVVRRFGGLGAILVILGTAGGLLPSLFWAGSWIANQMGEVYSLFEIEVIESVYGAVAIFSGVSWMLVSIGVLLTVLRMSAMIQRSEVLEQIRGGQE